MNKKRIESLDGFNHLSEYKVHWSDMDAALHVNNLVYMKWFESARIEFFDALDIDTSFSEREIGLILGWQDCKYLFPVTYPDTIKIGTRIMDVLEDRLVIQTAAWSVGHQRICAIGTQEIIPYDYAQLRKADIPASWIENLKAYI